MAATVEAAASAGCVASVAACAAPFVAGGGASTTASAVTASFPCPGHPAGKRKEGTQLLSPSSQPFSIHDHRGLYRSSLNHTDSSAVCLGCVTGILTRHALIKYPVAPQPQQWNLLNSTITKICLLLIPINFLVLMSVVRRETALVATASSAECTVRNKFPVMIL